MPDTSVVRVMDWKGRIVIASSLGLLAGMAQANLIISAISRPQVAMARQSTIIIWDPVTKVEHLIWSTAFASNTQQFDIVIPTPSRPFIHAVSYSSFRSLYNLTKNLKTKDSTQVIKETFPSPPNPAAHFQRPREPKEPINDFVRLSEMPPTYGARIIPASDVLALSQWMEDRGFKPDTAQKGWLQKYVEKKWHLTAFHIKTDAKMFETDAVRMSFKTDVPINPYSTSGRSWLRGIRQEVYMITPKQMQGYVGAKTAWKGKVDSHAFLNAETKKTLAKDLNIDAKELPANAWVHRFLEHSNDSVAPDDIYFYPTSTKPVPKGKVTRPKK